MKDDNEFREFINDNLWVISKSYAKFAPHEYLVKEYLDSEMQERMIEAVKYIRANGFIGYFGRNIIKNYHIYYKLDGMYYWTMGAPLEETRILNRCNAEDYGITSEGRIYYKFGH